MKRCRVPPTAWMTPWIVEGTPSVNMRALIGHSPISGAACTSLRGEPASSRTHYSVARYEVEETRSGTSRKCEEVRRQERVPAEGFERN